MTEPITALFNLCLSSASLPDEWKVSKIRPVPKKGDLSLVKNYRPISLLCTLSKVLESIIYSKIIEFIRPLLSHCQFGFLCKRSSLSQLLACFSKITDSIDSKVPVDVIYLDLSKAFDSVPHQELLFKLWRLGITGPLWQWFKTYLLNRSHFVTFKEESSSCLPVLSGVPQGSVLGPLLFLIYINDITDSISVSSPYIFADDAKLVKSINDLSDNLLLQNDITTFSAWSNEWKIALNALKCAAIRFSLASVDPSPVYSINDTPIVFSSTFRDLGVVVSSNLSWSTQINQVCSKAYRSFHLIKRNFKHSSPITLKKNLYFALIRSHLSYCSQLWRPHLLKDIKSLEKIQRRATSYILSDYASNYKSRLLNLNLLPLMYWLELQDLMFLIKCIKDPPDNFNIYDYISFSTSITRSATHHNLTHKYKRTSIGRHFYFNRIVRLWNTLPDIDLTQSCTAIKSLILTHFWSHFKTNFNSDNYCTYHFLCPCPNCHLHNHL